MILMGLSVLERKLNRICEKEPKKLVFFPEEDKLFQQSVRIGNISTKFNQIMKKIPFLFFIFSCLIIGLISCKDQTETLSQDNSTTQTEPTETVNSVSEKPDNNTTNNAPSSSKKSPKSTRSKNDNPPPKGNNWTTITNDQWTVTIGNTESWDGVNGTGDLTYYGCDDQDNCLGLTGGKITCRDGICTTAWRNGNYIYIIEEPITEDDSNSTTLIVKENDKVILNEEGFYLIDSNSNLESDQSKSDNKKSSPKILNNQELEAIEVLFSADETIIPQQSFNVNLEGWENCIFTSVDNFTEDVTKFDFYLIQNNEIIYTFPLQEDVTYWGGNSVNAVSFQDVDGDEDQDIIVIASYVTGVGRSAAEPFPVTTVYFNEENEFLMNDDLNLKLAEAQPSTIGEVNKILKDYF